MHQIPKPRARDVFAHNLRLLRRIKDISQEALALDAGLNRTYISDVERGSRNISIDNMESLAQALDVPLKDLLDPDQFKELDFIRKP